MFMDTLMGNLQKCIQGKGYVFQFNHNEWSISFIDKYHSRTFLFCFFYLKKKLKKTELENQNP